MKTTAAELRKLVEAVFQFLKEVSPEDAAKRLKPGSWSKKELIGHLIDSAANNHQRFVRAAHDRASETPGYEQDEWVASQGYADAPWDELLNFWGYYNLHLARVIEHLPETAMKNRVGIGKAEPETLEFVIADYVAHMKHHVGQLIKP